MHFDTSPRAALPRGAHALILAVSMLAACGDRIIVGREPPDLASAEPESALDAGASPEPGSAPEDGDRPDDEDSGGDDEAGLDDGDEPDDDEDSGDDDESNGDDDGP